LPGDDEGAGDPARGLPGFAACGRVGRISEVANGRGELQGSAHQGRTAQCGVAEKARSAIAGRGAYPEIQFRWEVRAGAGRREHFRVEPRTLPDIVPYQRSRCLSGAVYSGLDGDRVLRPIVAGGEMELEDPGTGVDFGSVRAPPMHADAPLSGRKDTGLLSFHARSDAGRRGFRGTPAGEKDFLEGKVEVGNEALDTLRIQYTLQYINLGFSPDGRYFVAALKNEHNLIYDIRGKREIPVPGPLKGYLGTAFAFITPDRIIGHAGARGEKSAIVEFPSGKVIRQVDLGGARPTPATHGDYILIRPIKDFAVGILDVNANQIVGANKQSAMDVYDKQYVSELKNGQ